MRKIFTIKPEKGTEFVADAFGIYNDFENKILDLTLPKKLPLITYITGESGCGKTTLMKELGYDETKGLVIPNKPLFLWHPDENISLQLLSFVGLGEATLFMQKYENLSDSQKFRAKIFLHLLSDEKIIFIDEFLSTLDRMTAKPVAYCLQKAFRKFNKQVVVSTAHSDLFNYLQPDLYIVGRAFPSRWEVFNYRDANILSGIKNPFTNNIIIQKHDKYWYNQCTLGELHYRGKYTGGIKDYWGCYFENKLVGILIGTYRMSDGGKRISRLVVHPSYRGIGIGVHLVKEYLKENPTADTIAAMAKYNPIFEKAGMIRVKDVINEPDKQLKKDLEKTKFNFNKWYDKNYCTKFMEEEKNRKILVKYSDKFGIFVQPGGKKLTDKEIKQKIKKEKFTAGRLLWIVRPKVMAKFKGK